MKLKKLFPLLLIPCLFISVACNKTDTNETDSSLPSSEETPTSSFDDTPKEEFSIHLPEIGNDKNGDAIYIKANDIDIVIDAGSREECSSHLINYINQYCTDGKLEYVLVSHAHQDHIAAFVGNSGGKNHKGESTTYNGLLYYYDVGTIIDFAKAGSTSQIYKKYQAARDYAVSKGAVHYNGLQCVNETDGAKKTYQITDSVSMTFLKTRFYESKAGDENDNSLCVLFQYTYQNVVKNYLFTGDLELSGEQSLVSLNQLPEVELFKAGHHGSKTSSNEILLSKIKPKNVIISCIAGSNEYTQNYLGTFPTQDAINRLGKYTPNIYVPSYYDYTAKKQKSLNGNIIFKTLGNETSVICSNEQVPLKDTTWFNSTLYALNGTISSQGTNGATEVPWRTWKYN